MYYVQGKLFNPILPLSLPPDSPYSTIRGLWFWSTVSGAMRGYERLGVLLVSHKWMIRGACDKATFVQINLVQKKTGKIEKTHKEIVQNRYVRHRKWTYQRWSIILKMFMLNSSWTSWTCFVTVLYYTMIFQRALNEPVQGAQYNWVHPICTQSVYLMTWNINPVALLMVHCSLSFVYKQNLPLGVHPMAGTFPLIR